jgi:hypothetical protein
MTEDVITNLARFKDLLVIARNSTLAYKGKPRQESMPEATPAAVVTLPSLTTRAFPKCSRQPKEADPCRPSRSPDEQRRAGRASIATHTPAIDGSAIANFCCSAPTTSALRLCRPEHTRVVIAMPQPLRRSSRATRRRIARLLHAIARSGEDKSPLGGSAPAISAVIARCRNAPAGIFEVTDCSSSMPAAWPGKATLVGRPAAPPHLRRRPALRPGEPQCPANGAADARHLDGRPVDISRKWIVGR